VGITIIPMTNATLAPGLEQEVKIRIDKVLAVGQKVLHTRAVRYARSRASDNILMCDGRF
jgi:hypothetical protein